jgi:hypothetical protein
MTNDYGAGFATAFKENYDGELCAESSYAEDAIDFTSMVESVIAAECDSVVMITYATDGAGIVEELANQDFDGMIFGGDGIADITFANEFSDNSSLDGLTVTRPAAAAGSPLGMLFDSIYGPTAAAFGYEGGIYTKEVFDAVAIIGLAQATAYRTPVDDGVKDMLGVVVAGPNAPQAGASGVHAFDQNGDVAGAGYEICTFWVWDGGLSNEVTLDCHSSWGRDSVLIDDGIPTAGDDCPFFSDAGLALCEEQEDGGVCDGETAAEGTECAGIVKDFCANNEDDGCAFFEDEGTEDAWTQLYWCNSDDFADQANDWEKAFCEALMAEPEPEPVVDDNTNATADDSNVTQEEVAEAIDEVPGFGLLSAVAAIGVVLLFRRKL